MMKLWLIDFDEAHPIIEHHVVMQCDREPTKEEASRAILSLRMSFAAIYINKITQTSESEMRGKKYYLIGGIKS